MLKIANLNKYYFKNKSNEIHVLNNINLQFNNKGLYFLLGPSGSGKSTLLNTIGLLDSFDNGTISIEEKNINKYKNVDDIRNQYFGYVFQNYLLNEEITVYENLEIVLKLINYKGDYYQRILSVLSSIGMEKYIKRKAKDLSGGQKQRIGIARCLIKSPKIILMDEPTGNLDEKNSINIMDIATKLSKDRLVIIVSHDENLASAYADYIIRLKDGQIVSNTINNNKHDININDNNHIYLKDFESKSLDNINIFYNKELPNLNIIIDHNKIYIKGSGDIEIINDNSPIRLINEHKVENKKEDVNINIEDIDNIESKHVLSFFSLFKQSFKTKYKKITTIAFVITSIIFASTLPFLSYLTSLDPMESVETNTFTYERNSIIDVKDIIPLLDNDDLLISTQNSNACVYINKENIPGSPNRYLNASYVPANDNLKFIKGSYTNTLTDIYLDEIIANRYIKRKSLQNYGIFTINDFLDLEITFASINIKGHIKGIVSTNEPSIYVHKEMLTLNSYIVSNEYNFLYSNPSKTNLNDNELLVNEKYKDVDDNENVVGTFTSPYEIQYLSNPKTAINSYYDQLNSYTLYTKNINKYENNLNVRFTNYRDVEIEEYYTIKKLSIISNLVFLIGNLVISLLFLYFIMKSSLIHRIKEVGINRSIGVKKFDIYKIFSSEIIAIVIKYSLPGYLITVLASIYLYNGGLLPGFNISYIPIGIIFYLLLAIIIGLIPVYQLLRKTPSEINKKYDI